jgi:two-component system, LytTR family, sensor kinase
MKQTGLWIAAWTMVGLLFGLPQPGQEAAWQSLAASLADWWAWGLLAPAILALDRRLPFPSAMLPARIGAHLAMGTVATLLHIGLRAALLRLIGGTPLPGLAALWSQALQGSFLWGMVVYFLIVGSWSAWRATLRESAAKLALARVERSLAEARLTALRAQLDPHFLFNALNTISSQVTADPRQARRMIEHLGDLLRLSLESSDRHKVPLSEELAFLDHYLAIQQIRFGAKLTVTFDIAPETRDALVPSLILQPLVENAIRHGLSPRSEGGSVTVRAHIDGNRLTLSVADDGIGLAADRRDGVGLSVTRERLAAPAAFALEPRAEGGTVARISLPLERA